VRTHPPLLAIDDLGPGDHVCALFVKDRERRSLATRFLQAGRARGERVLYVVCAAGVEVERESLACRGTTGDPAARDDLRLLTADDAYLRDGHFDPEAMLGCLRRETERALADGFTALRVAADMSPAVRNSTGESLLEYEWRLKDFLACHRCSALCQYDEGWTPPAALLGVLARHPIAVSGREVYENLLYVASDFMLDDDRCRAALRQGLASLLERRRVEEELQRTTARNRRLLESLRAVVWEADPRTLLISFVGDEVERLLGLRPEVWTDPPSCFHDHVHADDREQVTAYCAGAVRDGRPREFDCRVVQVDGRVCWVRGVVDVAMENGSPSALLGIFVDVTERRRTTDEIGRERDFSRLLVASSGDGIVAIDCERRLTVWNGAMERMFGVRAADVIGQPSSEACPSFPQWAELAKVLAGEQIFLKDHAIVAPATGQEWVCEARGVPLRDQGGKVVGGLGIVRDVTDRKRAEEALRDSESQYRLMFESNPQPMWVFDFETLRFVAVNEAAVDHYGYARREFRSMTLKDICSPELVPRLIEYLATTTAGINRSGPWRHRRRDGSLIDIEMTLSPLTLAGRASALVLAHDVTAQHRAEVDRTRQAAQLQALADAALAINSLDSLDEIVRVVTEKARAIVGANLATTELTSEGACAPSGRSVSLSEEYARYGTVGEEAGGFSLHLLSHRLHRPIRMTQVELASRPEFSSAQAFADPPLRGWLMAPLLGRDGRRLGLIHLSDKYEGDFTAGDEAILVQLAQTASVALEKAQLLEAVQAAEGRMRTLSAQVLEAQEGERRQIARELHDEIGQAVTAVKINLQAIQRLRSGPGLDGRVADTIGIVERLLQQVRALSLDLRPSMLDDFGLVAALRWYVDSHARRVGLEPEFSADHFEVRLPPAVETACFRIAQEALTNVARHARAQRVWVALQRGNAELRLRVRDDGTGFDVAAARAQAALGASRGLLSMQERAALLAGSIQIVSSRSDGTTVEVCLPLEKSQSSVARAAGTT
jgi:PAS domain S-box-containing protein